MSQFKPNGAPVNTARPNPASLAKVVSLHIEGKRKEALEEIERVLRSGQPTPEGYCARAHIQFELELYDAAAKSYEQLLSLDATDPAPNFNLALCLEKLGRWQDAAAYFGVALKAEPNR